MAEIPELIIKQIMRLVETNEQLRRDLKDCRNELCLRCGQYKTAHLGSCNGCRWRADNG